MAARKHIPLLSYRSVALYREDVELLGSGRWLNDAVMSFVFERLGERFDKGTFVSPCVAYFMLFERGGHPVVAGREPPFTVNMLPTQTLTTCEVASGASPGTATSFSFR